MMPQVTIAIIHVFGSTIEFSTIKQNKNSVYSLKKLYIVIFNESPDNF